MIKGILLMGGSGHRFGSAVPKQMHHLAGKQVYLHTLDRFVGSGFFDEVIIVVHPEWMERVREDVAGYERVRVIAGGKTRQESSKLGLVACGEETSVVCIHDAVRPFVTKEILRANIAGAKKWEAVDTCIPSTDTMVHSPDQKVIQSIPVRAYYLRGQTPQSFAYPLILRAHEQTSLVDATDDCTLAMEMGSPIHIVKGDETNIKITTELDLTLAEQILLRMEEKGASLRSIVGKVVVITGGTGGIGRAIAEELKAAGAEPITVARSGGDYCVDLTSYDETSKVFRALQQKHGPIYGLINCVGLFRVAKVDAMPPKEIQQLVDTNLHSVIATCQAACIEEGGHIVNFASSSYARGRAGYCVYSATKAAVVNFTQGLALERPQIHVNAIAPQRTDTQMRRRHFPQEDVSKLLSPQVVAEKTVELLQKEGITGSVVDIRVSSTLQLF